MSEDFGPTGIDPDWYDSGPGSENFKDRMREDEMAYHRQQLEEQQAEARRVDGLDAEIARLRKALEEIKAETCTMGIEWGDPKVHKIASTALAPAAKGERCE